MIDYTEATEFLDLENLEYLEDFCYNVVAVYDEGSSGFSNTACATPPIKWSNRTLSFWNWRFSYVILDSLRYLMIKMDIMFIEMVSY